MSLAIVRSDAATLEPPGDVSALPAAEADLQAAIRQACERIAPVWPLSSFVAVNPFLGFADMPFDRAAGELRRLTGSRLLMPRSFYRQAVREGRIEQAHLAAALSKARTAGLTSERLLQAVACEPPEGPPAVRVATVAEVLDSLSAGDRQVSRTGFMIDEISKWCAAYFDEGQAIWSPPWKDMPLYAAWRWSVTFDANPKAMGVEGLAETVAALPEDPGQAIAEVLRVLEIPAEQWADYLYRALFDVRGWAAFVRRLDWEAERGGAAGGRLGDFLAIRVVWGYALFRQRRDAAFLAAWRSAMANARPDTAQAVANEDLSVDLALHEAYEHAFQQRLIGRLAEPAPARSAGRPPLQAVFCIDVRSEVYRRALETVWPGVDTLGFAGFFGMPMTYGSDEDAGAAQCPVLLAPSFTVRAAQPWQGGVAAVSQRARGVFGRLKRSAVSCFGYVEAFGLGYAAKLFEAAAGRPQARKPPSTPSMSVEALDLDRCVDLAEGALRGMSLTGGFARLVLLVGHASSTVNNPHAAGLDCGACGGHSGAPNARFAAGLLNDPSVRAGLAERGIPVPPDTWFAAGLHDTTTDSLWLLDAEGAPPSHAAELEEARSRMEAASRLARAERAPLLGLAPGAAEQVVARSGDWSQIRPEWGLARAAAFIAAPRAVTSGRDLEGRAFLHSYDRAADPDLKVLELILTAPLVVATWIGLQYYGSTVDNGAFGAGDKTLHNISGRIGVLEGNAGDLRTGLPLQSVHDGERFVHEPLRLNAFIAAEPEAIARVLARQPQVRALLDNGWVHLFTLDDDGRTTHRYAGDLAWEALA